MTELDLFAAAVTIADPDARAALLDRECGDDPARRERLEKLLAAHSAAHPLLDPPATGTRAFADAAPTADPDGTRDRPAPAGVAGAVIAGRYKLLQRIGEGGMGEVWMAEQTQPVKRRVAVKLIRAERGTSKAILARFEAERQAIALMDHPHIAKLLDAGTAETGQPFFVMELVRGVPLTEYCDRHKLTVPERLNLFTRICTAVQHAHQKGVIHRDLKPSNILVESHDGQPVPKVIDFGLAKATTGLQLTEHTLFTAFGSLMGTPAYMAPEQATFNAVDVDTRADVYALGVLLYELLTGTTPLARDTLKRAALDEMLRLVREHEPPTPSSRLSSSDAAPGVAANRQTEPQKLGRFVKGELDWIALKALAKERDRRYGSAADLAADVGRFLNHEPVAAGPPTAGYKVRKFVRRHRGPVLAAALVLLVLLGGIGGTTFGLLRAEEKRREAEQARKDEAERAAGERRAKLDADAKRREAERSLVYARNRNEVLAAFVYRMFPSRRTTGTVDSRDALARTAKELDQTTTSDPLGLAGIQEAFGLALLRVGAAGDAIPLLASACEIRSSKLGAGDPLTLRSMDNLGRAYQSAGLPARAIPVYAEALRLRSTRLGPDHPDTLDTKSDLAENYLEAGISAKAITLFEEVFNARRTRFGAEHPDTLASMAEVGDAHLSAKAFQTAETVLGKCLALRLRVEPDLWSTFNSMSTLGGALLGQKKYADAEPLLLKGYEGMKAREKQIPPPGAARIPESLDRLVELYTATNKPDEAKKYKELRAKYPATSDAASKPPEKK